MTTGPFFGTDLYGRLGLDPDATQDQIEAAYRAWKAKGGDRSSSFVEAIAVEMAYQTLIDPAKRAAYDEMMMNVYRSVLDEVAKEVFGEDVNRAFGRGGLGGGVGFDIPYSNPFTRGPFTPPPRSRNEDEPYTHTGDKSKTEPKTKPKFGHYVTLNVAVEATQKEIKAAFKLMAKRWHPDVCDEPGAADRFRSCVEAYDVLGDENKRKRYDIDRGRHRGIG